MQATALGRAISYEKLAGGASQPLRNSAGILDSKPESAASPHGACLLILAGKSKLNSRQQGGPRALTNNLTPMETRDNITQMTETQKHSLLADD